MIYGVPAIFGITQNPVGAGLPAMGSSQFPTTAVGIGQNLCYIPRPRNSMKANTGYRHASSQAVI
ncbi:hypothetical protein C9422_11030 [Pseudomonas sp. B1(2018)]|nr:hypothetical protein C9422_11030 [Pseudomonas sp. B1(2018)]